MGDLFQKPLSQEALKIISENTEMVNKYIGEWVKNQRKANSEIAEKVVRLLTLVKRRKFPDQRELSCTPERKRMINLLVKRGHDMPQFKAVIEFKVEEWYGTKMERNLTIETLFAKTNFQKYLEEAREDWQKKHPTTTEGTKEKKGNQYYDLLADE